MGRAAPTWIEAAILGGKHTPACRAIGILNVSARSAIFLASAIPQQVTRIAGANFSFGDLTLEQSAEVIEELGFDLVDAHQVQLALGHEEIEVLHPYAPHFHAKQSAPGAFQARTDEGAIGFGRLIRKLVQDNYAGAICVEFVTGQDLLDAGWDFKRETARLKEILEEALAAT